MRSLCNIGVLHVRHRCAQHELSAYLMRKLSSCLAFSTNSSSLSLWGAGTSQGGRSGGAVTAVVTGKKELTKLTIKPDVIDPDDAEMLQDLVISAVNEALRQADDAMNNSMSSLTGGLNIPGLGL